MKKKCFKAGTFLKPPETPSETSLRGYSLWFVGHPCWNNEAPEAQQTGQRVMASLRKLGHLVVPLEGEDRPLVRLQSVLQSSVLGPDTRHTVVRSYKTQ